MRFWFSMFIVLVFSGIVFGQRGGSSGGGVNYQPPAPDRRPVWSGPPPQLEPSNPYLVKAANTAKVAFTAAQLDFSAAKKVLAATEKKLRDAFEATPDWKIASAVLVAAKATSGKAQSDAKAVLQISAIYRAACAARDKAAHDFSDLNEVGAEPERLIPAAQKKIDTAKVVTDLEAAAITGSPAVQAAMKAAADAQAAVDTLNANFKTSEQADDGWVSASTAAQSANDRLVIARQMSDNATQQLNADNAIKRAAYNGQVAQYNNSRHQ